MKTDEERLGAVETWVRGFERRLAKCEAAGGSASAELVAQLEAYIRAEVARQLEVARGDDAA